MFDIQGCNEGVLIPLFKVFMAPDVEKFVNPVLQSGYIGEGPKVKLLEEEVGEFIGNENVVAVNSGTAALLMALRLAGVEHGHTVLSTPMTCLATNTAILSLGANPYWADIYQDGTMSRFDVEGKLKSWPNIKAVMCVDWGGTPCQLAEIKRAVPHLPLIEDACQSMGSKYHGRMTGNDADYVCFSTQAIKYLTTGDGGFLVVPPRQLEEARLMRWFGLDRTKSASMRCDQDPPILGHKFQMNDIAAAIGLANIRHLPELIERTREHAAAYNKAFMNCDACTITEPLDDRQSNYWLYTILVRDSAKFIAYMGENGIECSKAHTRNDSKTLFRAFRSFLPGVDDFDARHVCIPVGWWLSNEDVNHVIETVKSYATKNDSQMRRQSACGSVATA